MPSAAARRQARRSTASCASSASSRERNGTSSSSASPSSSIACGSSRPSRSRSAASLRTRSSVPGPLEVPGTWRVHRGPGRFGRYPADVRSRVLRGELLLGAAAAVVGVVGIVSALTPEFAARSALVRGLLPPEVPGAARVLALSFGLGLVWLSRALARRRRRAWHLAVLLVVGISLAHLGKGLDVEEATLGLVLLVALVRYRSRFDVPGDPE